MSTTCWSSRLSFSNSWTRQHPIWQRRSAEELYKVRDFYRPKWAGERKLCRMFADGWNGVTFLIWSKGKSRRLVGLLVLSRQAQTGWPRPFFSGIAEHRHLGKLWLLMWGLAWVTLVTLTGLPYIHTLVSLDLRKQALLWECPARW